MRSRVTRPNAQSVISCSPVNHSSVQVKKIVPARPHLTTLSTCQPSISACSSSRMPDRVHAEFAEHERPIFREILQAEQVLFEVALVVQVNVETVEIDVLREEIFRRRITRVGKENVRIDLAPDPNEMLDKFRHPAHAEPAHHRGRRFRSRPDNRRSPDDRHSRPPPLRTDRDDRIARAFLRKELDMLRPRQRDQDAHPGSRAAIEKPERRDVINANDVDPELAHLGEIALRLIGWPKIVPVRVRFERPVGDAFDEELAVAFEEKFRDRTDRARSGAHSGSSLVSGDRTDAKTLQSIRLNESNRLDERMPRTISRRLRRSVGGRDAQWREIRSRIAKAQNKLRDPGNR